jgi:hypothetical protein
MPPIFKEGIGGAPASLTDYNANVNLTENSFSDLGPYIISGLAISAGTGLSASVAAGVAFIGGRLTIAAPLTITGLTDATTNHLYLKNDGTGTSNTTGTQPANSVKLGTAITAAGVVSSVQQNWTAGRQLLVRQNLEVHGGGAGDPRAIDLASWHATNNEGNEVKGTLPAGAVPAGNSVTGNVLSARPAASHLGNVFLPTDGESIDYDLGSSWASYGPIFRFTTPDDSHYFWVNQNDASVTVDNDSILLTDPANTAGTDAAWRFANAPFGATPPYRVTAFFISNQRVAKTDLMTGMAFRESGTGKLISFHWNNGFIWTTKWNSANAINSDYSNFACPVPPGWIQIRDDGTNLTFWLSGDGQVWQRIESRARNNFFTTAPDECGFFVSACNAGTPNFEVNLRLMSWTETA